MEAVDGAADGGSRWRQQMEAVDGGSRWGSRWRQ